jgi:membrane-associated phospholipid phosphatase
LQAPERAHRSVRRIAIDGAVAAASWAFFLALGDAVRRGGEPRLFTGWESAWLDHGSLIAWWLTWSCYVYALVPAALVLLVVAWRVPAWRARILLSVAVLLLCWLCADAFQHYFARPRRLDWVVRRETAFSYPSSHATISTGFFGLWAAMIFASDLPRRVRTLVPAALAALVAAVWWARLALGAHYLTDVIGGALLALAIVSTALAVVPVKVFARPAGRP